MFRENIIRLRSIHNMTQEEVASKVGISRQAYQKWESGESIPDINKCASLASIYDVSIDSLIEKENSLFPSLPPSPKGKNIWGSVILSEKGEIVIPQEARKKLGFTSGTRIVVLSDEYGIALLSADTFEKEMKKAIELSRRENS